MPLHVGKGRTESRAISDIIDYVANPKKTDNGRLITGYACDSRTADAEFLLAKRQYIAATGRVRGADDVIAYHVRQSFRPGEITPEEANRLGVEFAKRFTKGNGNVSSDESHGIIERQADTLASALLMPLPQIKKCFYRLKIGRTDEQLIAEMANIFEVSKQAMQIRLKSRNLI